MKLKIIIISILFAHQLFAQSYQKIHDKAILIDTHNDFLSKTIDYGYVFDTDLTGKTHSDLARLKKGGIDVQLFSVFCDGNKKNPYEFANRQMDSLDAVLKRNPDKIVKVANSKALPYLPFVCNCARVQLQQHSLHYLCLFQIWAELGGLDF